VILFFSSLEGSAGGRLGGLMLSQLRERYPAVPVLVVGVLPHAKPTADPAVAWHAALALQRIRREAAAAVLFSNDVLIRRAGRLWETGGRSGYGAANQLIAEALAAVTGPLRFGGRDTAAADPVALIEALGNGEGGWPPLVTAHNWPLGRLSFLKSPQPRLSGVVAAAVRFARRQKGFAGEMSALGIYLRGRWHEAAAAGGRRRGGRVQTVALTGRTTPWAYESLTVVASSPEIEESLERIARRAASHLRRFPEAVAAAGIDRGQLGAAIRALRERQAGQGEEGGGGAGRKQAHTVVEAKRPRAKADMACARQSRPGWRMRECFATSGANTGECRKKDNFVVVCACHCACAAGTSDNTPNNHKREIFFIGR
jgi:hypothetical protein